MKNLNTEYLALKDDNDATALTATSKTTNGNGHVTATESSDFKLVTDELSLK